MNKEDANEQNPPFSGETTSKGDAGGGDQKGSEIKEGGENPSGASGETTGKEAGNREPIGKEEVKASSSEYFKRLRMGVAPAGTSVDPFDALFAEERRVYEVRGTHCEVPDLKEIRATFAGHRCLLVAFAHKEHSLSVATRLATQLEFPHIYLVSSEHLVSFSTTEMVQRLCGRQSATCVIWDRTTGWASEQFEKSLYDFGQSTKGIDKRVHGLIVLLDLKTSAKLERQIPDHVLHMHRAAAENERVNPPSAFDVEGHVKALFSPQAQSFEEMQAVGDRTLIPCTLARLAVLFPELSTSNMDALLRCVLRGREVEVVPARDGVAAKMADASALWAAHRATFEPQAGLTRDTSGKLSFGPDGLSEATSRWVWSYPEELYELFAAVSRQGVLFSDYLDEDEKELFDAYFNAAIELAKREPKLFGGRWLTTLLREFAAWVREEVPQADSAPPGEDAFALLAQMAEHLAKQKRSDHFWARFAERMGSLCGALFRGGSHVIVTNFFERMSLSGLHELLLQVIARMGDSLPAPERLKWAERVLLKGDQDARLLVARDLAVQLLWYPERAGPYLERLGLWLEEPVTPDRSLKREAALGTVVRLFSEASRKAFDPAQESSPLLEALPSATAKAGSLAEFCEKALGHREFPVVAAMHLPPSDASPAERPSLAVAVSLYQCAMALPPAAVDQARAMARAALGPLGQTERNRVAGWWKRWADDARKQMPWSLAAGKESRRREEMMRREQVLGALMSS